MMASESFDAFVLRYARDYRGAALAFDFTEIAARVQRLLSNLDERTGLLFAVKAFGHPTLLSGLARVARGKVGFDVSNARELQLLLEATRDSIPPNVISVTGPLAHTVLPLLDHIDERTEVLLNIDSPTQFRRVVGRLPDRVVLGARIAVAPMREPSEELASRFGFDPRRLDLLSELVTHPRFGGVHCHLASEFAEDGAAIRLIDQLVALSHELGADLAYVNLGGGRHIGDAACASRAARRAPAGCKVYFEPGRAWSDGAGVAICRVLDVKPLRGRGARVTVDLSAECHLRWSRPTGLSLPDCRLLPTEPSEPVSFQGPTCYEADVLGCYVLPGHGDQHAVMPGDSVIFSGISSYAAAWNQSFNGVPPAEVIVHADA